jgi:hypothetical protein
MEMTPEEEREFREMPAADREALLAGKLKLALMMIQAQAARAERERKEKK